MTSFEETSGNPDRRMFLKGVSAILAGTAVTGLVGCAQSSPTEEATALSDTGQNADVEELREIVQDLYARESIRQKLYQYCRSVDRADADLGYAVFAEDSDCDYSPDFRGTGKDLIDWVVESAEGSVSHSSHQLTNITIQVDGDKAGSEAYCRVCMSTPVDESNYSWFEGSVRYSDTWEERDGDWVIVTRVTTWDCGMSIPYEINMEPVNTSRDKNDPSYQVLK